MNKTNFRNFCIKALSEQQAKEKRAHDRQEVEDNKERQQTLENFLRSHMKAEGFHDNDQEIEFEVKDATYNGEGFLLTVGSREEQFPVIAEGFCRDRGCGEILVQREIKNLAEIGAIILQANDAECPHCENEKTFGQVFGD